MPKKPRAMKLSKPKLKKKVKPMEPDAVNKPTPSSSRRFYHLRALRTKLSGRLQNPKVLVLLLFVLGFAAVGAYLLIFSQAAVVVKPQFSGAVDRQGQPKPSDHYPSPINGFVVHNPVVAGQGKTNTTWAELQPTQGGPIASNNAIDQAIAHARATDPSIRLKLRIYVGFGAPEWAKNLPVTSGQQGPFEICNQNTGDGAICGTVPCADIEYCGTVGHFWEQNFRDAYKDLQVRLAAKYDGVPEIEEVAITGCSTSFGEPFLRQADYAGNITAYKNAGYNEAANKTCFQDTLEAHKAWTTTRSSIALNPYQEYDASVPKFKSNEDYTESYMDECRRLLGERCVLGNNSIGKKEIVYTCPEIGAAGWTTKDSYARMYTKIKCLGAPIYYQTATAAKIVNSGNTLAGVLDWAAEQGAGMVELPAGYNNTTLTGIYLSPADLKIHDDALHANAKPAINDTVSAPTVASINPSSGSTAGGTAVTITGANFEAGATVVIGGVNAASVNRLSSTSITATTPAHAAGVVNVKVTNLSGEFTTLSNGFTYTENASGCNHTIPSTTGEVDGQANYSQVQPGNVLCIPGGSRGALILNNLHGTAASPIIIRNSTGPVNINLSSGTGAIVIKNSSYVRVTGTGASDKCGSEYAVADQQCGFVLSGAGRGVSATSSIDHIETDHLEIKNTGAAGIKFHGQDNPDLVITGVKIHHNYVHDINVAGSASEGMYIGSNAPPTDPAADNYNLEDVDVNYNLVERTAWDGINVKQAIKNVKVHHNIVRDAGLLKLAAQSSGIALREVLNGEIYNNYVINSGQTNIKTGDARGAVNNKYFNNIVVGAGNHGMEFDNNELDPKIYNNTVVTSQVNGIKIASSGTTHQAYDNIVVGSGGLPIAGSGTGITNNHMGTVSSAGFINSVNGDYHLSSTSSVVDAGRSTGLFPVFDYDDKQRPSGTKTDQGAFEYASSTADTPTDIEKPTAPSTLRKASEPTHNQVSLVWDASTDNVGVTRYQVFRGANGAAPTFLAGVDAPNTTFLDTYGVTENTSYVYFIKAKDAAGNPSDPSPSLTVQSPQSPDTTDPTPPTTVTVTEKLYNKVTLIWSGASDNRGVVRYIVQRDGITLNDNITATSYSDTTVMANTTYNYTIRAVDAAIRISTASNPPTAVTTPQATDTTPPTAPSGLAPTGYTTRQVNLKWNAAADNVGVSGYNIYRNGVKIRSLVTSLNFGDGTVGPNTRYDYYVTAVDVASLEGPKSNIVTIQKTNGSK